MAYRHPHQPCRGANTSNQSTASLVPPIRSVQSAPHVSKRFGVIAKCSVDSKDGKPVASPSDAPPQAPADTDALSSLEALVPSPSPSTDGQEGASLDTTRMSKTLSDLDLLLGIEPEPEEKEEPKDAMTVGVADNVLKQIAEAEAGRAAVSGQEGSAAESKKELENQMARVIAKAKLMGETPLNASDEQKAVQQELKKIMSQMQAGRDISGDLDRIKKEVFGPTIFWVTDTVEAPNSISGVIFQGNLRAEAQTAFETIQANNARVFGDKYTVFMVPDPQAMYAEAMGEAPSSSGNPKVAFQIVSSDAVVRSPNAGWQNVLAAVLLLASVATCVELGAASNVLRLPPETIQFFANPDNAGSDLVPPGLDRIDTQAFVATSLAMAAGVGATQLAQDFGQRATAMLKQVKLGPWFVVPSVQLGVFGSILQIKSLMERRIDQIQLTAAGPLLGGSVAAGLFAAGLASSAAFYAGGGLEAAPDTAAYFVPVPSAFLQGSLLLGGVTQSALGESVTRTSQVLLDPLLIAGWCGLTTTALNLLPAGTLNGGRLVFAAYGPSTLALLQFFVYVSLAFGWLAGPLSLPFGLYVLICQRQAESVILDTVTEPAPQYKYAIIAAVAASLLILSPMGLSEGGVTTIGPGTFI